MRRRVWLNILRRTTALSLAVFAFNNALCADDVERRSPVSELEKSQYEKNLEDRLARDIKSYLGHDFFIVRADALLDQVNVYRIEETPIPAQPPALAVLPQPRQEPQPDQNAVLSQMELETEDGINAESLSNVLGMETPLPGIPISESIFEEAKRNERKKQRQNVAPPKPQPPPPAPQPQQTVAQPEPQKKITETLKSSRVESRKLAVKVILDEHVAPEQELFIRQLVIEKADLNFIRGDELKMLRSDFPGAAVLNMKTEESKEEPVADEAPKQAEELPPAPPIQEVEEPKPDWQQWLEKYWPYALAGGLLFLLLLVWFLTRNRSTGQDPKDEPKPMVESETSRKLDELLSKMSQKQDTISDNRLQVIREEIVSLAVTDYPLVSQQLKDWLNSGTEDDQARLAGLLNLMEQGYFASLFKSLMDPETMVALVAKAQEQAAELSPNEQLLLAEAVYQTLLQRRYKEQHNMTQEARPFAFLERLNDDQVLYLLTEENLKVKALVLSQLSSDRAATLLRRFGESERSRIATEISRFDELPISAFRDVANRLARRAVNVPSFANVAMDGVDLLIDMLDHMSTADETKLLSGLRKDNPQLFYQIKQVYISFNDIARIPKLGIKNLIREVEREQLALALYDMSDAFKEAIFAVMLERPRAMLESTIKGLNQPDNASIENAKRIVARRARAMLKAGAFTMPNDVQPRKGKPQQKQPPPKGAAAGQ